LCLSHSCCNERILKHRSVNQRPHNGELRPYCQIGCANAFARPCNTSLLLLSLWQQPDYSSTWNIFPPAKIKLSQYHPQTTITQLGRGYPHKSCKPRDGAEHRLYRTHLRSFGEEHAHTFIGYWESRNRLQRIHYRHHRRPCLCPCAWCAHGSCPAKSVR